MSGGTGDSADTKEERKSMKKEEVGLDEDESKAVGAVKEDESQRNRLVEDAASEDEDEEGGGRHGDYDSSEEDEDEEDEEAIRKVREGFIVSDDEAEEEGEDESGKEKEHKRKHGSGSEEELDEDDLELLRENAGEPVSGRSKFKRLKRGGDEEGEEKGKSKGLTEMFSDEENEGGENEEEDDLMEASRRRRQQREGMPGEFDDFIEDDEMSEDDDDRDERLARMRSARAKNQFSAQSRVDQDKMDELFEIFGDGEDYAWALEAEGGKGGEEGEGEGEGEDKDEDHDQDKDDDKDKSDDKDHDHDQNNVKDNSISNKLKDVFELGELKKHLLTDEDEAIRTTDVPERFQLLRKGIDKYELSDEEFVEEQQWIAKKLFDEKSDAFDNAKDIWDPFKDSVFHVVEFVCRDNLEVPVIWSCRKDYTLHTYQEDGQLRVQKLLNENDLWRIVQLDIEYHGILEKRRGLQRLFDSLHVVDILFDRLVKGAASIPALQDLHDYVSFTYSREMRGNEAGAGRRLHSRFAPFERIRADPIYRVVEALGMSAEHLGENVSSDARIYVTEDPAQPPEEMVRDVLREGEGEDDGADAHTSGAEAHPVGANAHTPDADAIRTAIDAVVHMYSEELAHSPELRAHLRTAYRRYATVDIVLTAKGRDEIGAKSPYADFKYAVNRAMESFAYAPDLFPRMLEAEARGLCRVELGLKAAYKGFVDHLFTFLSSDGTSDVSAAWNALRRRCLDVALGKMLPVVAAGVKDELRRRSETRLFFRVRDGLLAKVDQAPFAPQGRRKGAVPRVLALSNGDGRRDAAVLAAALDRDGAVLDCVKFEENFRDSEFERKLVDLVGRLHPDVIAVSGYTPDVSQLYKHVEELAKRNALGAGAQDGEEFVALPVIYAPNETALVFEHSARARREFGDKPAVAKFCIGLARYVQDPLVEYIALGDAISSVAVDAHQRQLSSAKFHEAVESIFVDMVCLVGVRLNDAARAAEGEARKLRYVAGFGRRKAAGVLRAVAAQGGEIARRDELILKRLVAKTVFMNCAAFINLPAPDRYDGDVELLDATRIHPEDYELARKMASDALDLTDEDRAEIEHEEGGVVGKLYEEGAGKLDDLLLEGYAEQLERHGHRKRATLEMIKEELQNNFEELRQPFRVPAPEQVFAMLTGETPRSFRVGLLVPAVVQRVDPRYLSVVTQSGVRGTIARSAVLPYNDPGSLPARFVPGQPVRAVVKAIDYADFRADLSLLREDLEGAERADPVPKFKGLWDFAAEERDGAAQVRDSRMAPAGRVGALGASGPAGAASSQLFKHPFFRNLSAPQAVRYLASRDNGAFVIRPSSKGPDHLAVTWKIANQLFQHFDVHIVGQPTSVRPGTMLEVGRFRYHDLDELIVSHINKLYANVVAISHHDKFRDQPAADAKAWLLRYSKANKNRSCYCFCFNRKAPGWFLLLFKLNDDSDRTYTWNVNVLPTGFMLHGNVYPDMVHLCNGFKRLLQNQLSGSQGYGY